MEYNMVTGIFLTKVGKETAQRQLSRIGNKYLGKYGLNYKQDVAMLKTVCRNLIAWIDECLMAEMAAATRYRRSLEACAAKDNPAEQDALWIYGILTDFNYLVATAIPLNELPSCRKFIEPSSEDIVSKFKSQMQDEIAETEIGAILFVHKAEDLAKISQIKDFYQQQLQILQSDIEQIGRPANSIESVLLQKFNSEIDYCNRAMLKTSTDAIKELTEQKRSAQR